MTRAIVHGDKTDVALFHGDRPPANVAGVERIVVGDFDITTTAAGGLVIRANGIEPVAIRPIASNMLVVETVRRVP